MNSAIEALEERVDALDAQVNPDSDADGFPDAIDCHDGNSAIHPGATEIENDLDDDCDGVADDGLATSLDLDDDGWEARIDCDDTNPRVNPGVREVQNGIDDDCDSLVDEGFI